MVIPNSFGVPSDAIHYFVVDVPSKRESTVRVIEVTNGYRGEHCERSFIDRDKWIDIRDGVAREFNNRMKKQSLPRGKWSNGVNFIDRLLGKELVLLCWALQYDKIGNVFHRWLELREEDRWWLFNMGIADDAWKRAAGQGVAGV